MMVMMQVPSRRTIQPDGLFDARPYGFSQGLVVEGVLYVSGQVSRADGLAGQVAEAWASVLAVVEAAGGSPSSLAKITVFTLDEAAWSHLRPLIEATTAPDLPAATMVKVSGLANPELLVEIEAIAHLPRPTP